MAKIHMATQTIPGPRAKAILDRLARALPRAATPGIQTVVDRAHGALLTDVDGNTFIDLTGGVGVLNVGHTNDHVVRHLEDQIHRFLHTDFTNVPYESYVTLAEKINARFPGKDARTIFFNSGAEAVENAIKIARVASGRKGVIAFQGAFHGRTMMAMTLTSKVKPYKEGMGPYAPEVYRVPFPNPYRCPFAGPAHTCSVGCYEEELRYALETTVAPSDVAAIIVEPVQGEGGFIVPPKDFLPFLRRFCDEYGILLICDEVQTGFGRTGTFFATEQSNIVPDLMTFAKSVADGLPLSGVIGRAQVMDAPPESSIGGTYVGNPVACAAGLGVMETFESEDLLSASRRQGEFLRARLSEMQKHVPEIGDVRGLGAMTAVEFVQDRETKEPNKAIVDRTLETCVQRGVLMLRAGIFGNVIRFLAPLNTPEDVLSEALDVLEDALRSAAPARR